MYRFSMIATVGLVLVVGLVLSGAAERSYVAGRYALELDGIVAGWVKSVEGGHATSDVVIEQLGPDYIQKKHISNLKYEDIKLDIGIGMSRAFWGWIESSLARKYNRKSGAIIAADYDYKEKSRLEFTDALITEVGMPALDGASKDPCYMTLKIAPETTRRVAGSGKPIQAPPHTQKKWLTSNFRLTLGDLDCTRVNKIEAITIKQKVIEDGTSNTILIGDVPNLGVTMPEGTWGNRFYDWADDFVIKGNNGDDKELRGRLEYLAPDLKSVLFYMDFAHVGVFKVAPDKWESGAEGIRRVKAEMYCEDIRFGYTPAATE